MPGTKEIRVKIKSVQNTRKITKAMEMVAASKMRKAQERMRMARPYGEKIRTVAAHISHANPEYRHPFLDLRVVEFCLSLPPHPWCHRKEILRQAVADSLPREVARRPKTPLAGFPHMLALREESSRWVDTFEPCDLLAEYVERAKIPSICGEPDPATAWRNLRPLSLDLWLRHAATATLH